MNTRILHVDSENPDPAAIAQAAVALRRGEIVAFPTETVYGLGANGLDESAVRRVFAAKRRPPEKGLILHLADREGLEGLVEDIPPAADLLIARFAPGPLTLVLRAAARVPQVVLGGGATVAVRWPDHPVARALIRAAGVPVAAPSANLSGQPPPRSAAEVARQLAGRIPWILDGGETPLGQPSTIVDLTVQPPAILREGAIPGPVVLAALAEADT